MTSLKARSKVRLSGFLWTRDGAGAVSGEEIHVDNFAGGGGVGLGFEMVTGRAFDCAINHDPASIEMHQANHPATRHLCESVWKVDPVEIAGGRRVGLAWFSPDCTHFSRAKGKKPVKKKIRGLAWVAVRWAKRLGVKQRPRVIILENVREFQDWGPLTAEHMPCPHPDPIGPENNDFIRAGVLSAEKTIIAWGKHGKIGGRAERVLKLLDGRTEALAHNADGSPRHPLYVPYEIAPVPIAVEAGR